MADNVFSQIIPLTAAMALPFPVIKGTRLLLAGRPVAHSLIFIVTWGMTCFLTLSAAVMGKAYLLKFYGVISTFNMPEEISSWIHIIMGLLFISIGVKKLKLAMEQESAPVPKQALHITPSSIMKSTMKGELFKLKNGALLLLIIHKLLNSDLAYNQSLVAAGMISLTAMIWVSMPLMVYFWTGRKRDVLLEALKSWLIKNYATLGIFIYMFLGISILSSGVGDLMPELLEIVFEDIV